MSNMINIIKLITSLSFITASITLVAVIKNYLRNLIKPNTVYTPSSKWVSNGVQIIPAHFGIEKSMDALIVAPKFVNWLQNILCRRELLVHTVTVTDVDWFAAKPDPVKLGFVKCVLTGATDAVTGKKVMSNIVFIRGNSVAVLIIVTVLGKTPATDAKYVLLCEQMRAPFGKRVKEICAGMTDAEGNILSVVLKEVKEETGINVQNVNQLITLGTIMPSPGACDELIYLYAYETVMSQLEFEEKQSRLYGNTDEQEEIKLQFVKINEYENNVLEEIADVKGECAFRRYKQKIY